MTFEKDFPELKDRKVELFVTSVEFPNDGRRKATLVTDNKEFVDECKITNASAPMVVIQKDYVDFHCLSKQRVKKTIDDFFNNKRLQIKKEDKGLDDTRSVVKACDNLHMWEDLNKELGL